MKKTDKVIFEFYNAVKETEKAICLHIDVNAKWCDGDDIRWDKDVWFPRSQIEIEGNNVAMPRWLAEDKDLNRFMCLVSDEEAEKDFEERRSKYCEVIERAKALGIKGIRSGMRYATILRKAEEQGIEFAL